jgi:polyhydroxyalkanoate synthesis regulator phasin
MNKAQITKLNETIEGLEDTISELTNEYADTHSPATHREIKTLKDTIKKLRRELASLQGAF